ncbi:MAG: outer membrane protein assembly factor BamA [Salaquimonas sp.]|nr:outer membrane protein assembly factor BamA [Salaquimonas sp.]
MVRVFRAVAAAAYLAILPATAFVLVSTVGVEQASAAVVSKIDVRGNSRMDADTIITYLTIKPGKPFSNIDIDESVKSLYTTGLFADVSIYQSGNTLVVEVDESGIVNEVFFEGNKRLKDEGLASIVQTGPRSPYSQDRVTADVDRILEAYARVGRKDATVTYEIVPLANKRVNVVFRINEGDKTKIRSISFVGNHAFGARRLHDVLDTKQSNFLSWLKTDDVFDQQKLSADEEKLRLFYYNNGYADFQILSTDVNFDAEANAYFITISVDEGQRYTFGNVTIDNSISEIDGDALYPLLKTVSGKHYSAKEVESSVVALTEAVAEKGYAFVQVTPRGNRDFDTGVIDVTYQIDQGPRVYIQQITIIGNDRTREHVIRREFDISEGDALNQVLLQKAKRRLEATGFFERVNITTRPGNAPDRVVVVVHVVDKATGEFSVGGGWSTTSGVLAEISFEEKNFLGRGQYLKVAAGFGTTDTDYTLSFTEPYFLGYRMSAGFDLTASSSDASNNREYGINSQSAVIRFGIPITDNLSANVYYTYNNQDTVIPAYRLDPPNGNHDGIQGDFQSELSAALAPPFAPTSWTKSGFGYLLTYNSLDTDTNPHEGDYLTFRQDFYGAGGDAGYFTTQGAAVSYATLSEEADLVGMLRARAGANVIYAGSGSYRASDNFYQGSRYIRGFDNYGFGPRDPMTGDALGGMYYWNATAEVTFPMPYFPDSMGIRGGFFVDAGQLWGLDSASRNAILTANPTATTGHLDDNPIRAAAGVSVIWLSPFGPLRFDYAFPFSRAPWDRVQEFNFGISTAF